ncbi:MAG: conjugal transfer protein TraG N-terminal domain-containing protein [Desulfobulbaceae bacterium]
MKRNIASLTAAVACLCLAPASALALDMEYYTYGGFNPIVQAFTRVALIFSDAGYQGLLFVIMVLGLLASASAWLARAATGARVVPLVWAVPVLAGAVLYLALFVPKGNITVYDPVLNRFQTIGDVPDAIVFTAGFLNKIERGMVDIIDTAAAPDVPYQRTAGGIGFKALESVKGSSPKNNYARTSMIRYVKDCVTFELMRPGTTLSLDDLRNNTSDFLTDLDQAVNPAVYTVYYDASSPEGENVTCTEAWRRLRPIYANPLNYDEAIRKVCSKSYFDPASSGELNTCRELLTSTLNFTTGTGVTPEKIIQQRQIAEILYSFYFEDDYETAMLMESNRKITATGLGIGLTMNEWIPVIRAIMTAVAIGVIPFLVLFLPTPVVGKAASVMFGFFVFLTTWGITDAVIHGAAMDYAAYAFEDMRQSSLGVYAMAAFPVISVKLLAMFGVIRSAGIMLASFFSMMLIRFGGHALAMLAGNLSHIAQTAGAQAGQLLTPEGTATALNQQVQAAGLLQGMPEHRFSNMATAQAWGLHRSVGSYSAAMNTRNVLQKTGQVSPGVSDSEMATMMASAGVRAGTSTGPVEVSTAPDGHGTRIKSEAVNADGSTSNMTTGADGTGMRIDTSAAGRATYAVDRSGKHQTTQAAVNGLDPVKVGAMAQHQMISAASNRLGTDTSWNTALQQIQKDSLTSSEASSFSNTLNNRITENWKRTINDRSSFVHTMDQNTQNVFNSSIGAGFDKILSLSGSGTITVVGKDGERVDFNISEDTARAFARDQVRVRAEAFRETLQDSNSLDYATQLAKTIGASEAYSFLRDAKHIESATESYGADLTTALVRNYARERYGDDSPENIRRTISDFNEFLTQQGSQGVANMHDIVQGFVSGGGFGWGSTADDVHNAIDLTRGRIQTGMAVQSGRVSQAAATADTLTSGIRQDSFTAPKSDTMMSEPTGEMAMRGADRVRQFNNVEESGEGRIRTTAAGMASEATGSVFKGLVDSQPDRLDSESIYYTTPDVAEGVTLPEPGPVQGAYSTLGNGNQVEKKESNQNKLK